MFGIIGKTLKLGELLESRPTRHEFSNIPSDKGHSWLYAVVQGEGGDRQLRLGAGGRVLSFQIDGDGGDKKLYSLKRLADLHRNDLKWGKALHSGKLTVHSSSPTEIHASTETGTSFGIHRDENGQWFLQPKAPPRTQADIAKGFVEGVRGVAKQADLLDFVSDSTNAYSAGNAPIDQGFDQAATLSGAAEAVTKTPTYAQAAPKVINAATAIGSKLQAASPMINYAAQSARPFVAGASATAKQLAPLAEPLNAGLMVYQTGKVVADPTGEIAKARPALQSPNPFRRAWQGFSNPPATIATTASEIGDTIEAAQGAGWLPRMPSAGPRPAAITPRPVVPVRPVVPKPPGGSPRPMGTPAPFRKAGGMPIEERMKRLRDRRGECRDCGEIYDDCSCPKTACLEKFAQAILRPRLNRKIEQAGRDAHPNPSDAQCEAGNYPMGHVWIQGLDISIEVRKGGWRVDKKNSPPQWRTQMKNAYGYIRNYPRSKADGDHVDVFLGDHPDSQIVFVIDQNNGDGEFDEHKCLIGFTNEKDAKEAYLANFSPGWRGFRSITAVTMQQFKAWLLRGATGKPMAKMNKSASTFLGAAAAGASGTQDPTTGAVIGAAASTPVTAAELWAGKRFGTALENSSWKMLRGFGEKMKRISSNPWAQAGWLASGLVSGAGGGAAAAKARQLATSAPQQAAATGSGIDPKLLALGGVAVAAPILYALHRKLTAKKNDRLEKTGENRTALTNGCKETSQHKKCQKTEKIAFQFKTDSLLYPLSGRSALQAVGMGAGVGAGAGLLTHLIRKAKGTEDVDSEGNPRSAWEDSLRGAAVGAGISGVFQGAQHMMGSNPVSKTASGFSLFASRLAI